MTLSRSLRAAAALALLVGGLIHLDLYFNGYRSLPEIGRGFMVNAIASGVLAAAVAARREWFVRVAGIGLAAGTLVAFWLTRRGDGLFNFREQGLHPSPQAALALFVEIAAVVLLGLTFLPAIAARDRGFGLAMFAATTAAAALALTGFGVSFASDHSTVLASTPTGGAVVITNFSFMAPSLTVAAGTTVRWTNKDSVIHSVAARDKSFTSKSLSPGDTFEFTFKAAGDIAYICGIHPSMSGTVSVSG